MQKEFDTIWQSNSSLREKKTGKTERNVEPLIPTCSSCEADSALGTTESHGIELNPGCTISSQHIPACESPEIRMRFPGVSRVQSEKRSRRVICCNVIYVCSFMNSSFLRGFVTCVGNFDELFAKQFGL